MKHSKLLFLALLGFGHMGPAAAAYPDRAVTIVVPFSPGGAGDTVARIVASKLTTQTGTSFVVLNKTGAAGRIGYDYVAKSAPNGYTLVAIDSSYTMYTGLYGSLPWKPKEDLVGVTISAQAPFALIVGPHAQAKDFADFVKKAKADPGGYNYGSAGVGSANHIGMHFFAQAAGIELTHIPYKGMGESMSGLIGGSVDAMLTALPTAMGQAKGGKVQVLAVSSQHRSPAMPDVPAMAEAGVSYLGSNWFGLAAPKDTPPEAIAYLNREVAKALASPDIKDSLLKLGLEAVGNTPQEFNKILQTDIDYWARELPKSHIRAE